MVAIENLKEYCRTCLMRLEKSYEKSKCKSISLQNIPYIQRLIQICLSNPSADEDSICYYAPFICSSCFNKWTDFSKLYQIAIKTDEQIKMILKKEDSKTEVVEREVNTNHNGNIKEYPINAQPNVQNYIEQYDTESPFFTCINDVTLDYSSVQDVSDPTQSDYQQNGIFGYGNEDDNSFLSENDSSSTTEPKTKNTNFKNGQMITRNSCTFKKSLKNRNARLISSECNSAESKSKKVKSGRKSNKKERYQCEKCKQYFWEKLKYDGHMKQVHEGIRRPYECLQCDKSYNLYKTLLQHNREHHNEKLQEIFKCEQCDKFFKTAVILRQHLNNKHSEQKELMRSICDQCGFIAAHQYSLTRHIINKHTETDQIKCDQCPKVFKTRYSLKYHVLGNHNLPNYKPFKCSECQMGFNRKTLLNQHKQTHLKYTERMKCDFEGCEVRFVKRGDKTHHMRLVHLKIKQHICDFCGEAFGAMQTLRHHRFIHTGEKPYKCNVCGQGFRQRTAMKTHRKTHLVKEPEGQD